MCIKYMDLAFINAYTKFYQNSSRFVMKILRKNTFLHQSRAMTLLFINEFSPFEIPKHSSLISMSTQSLKKIGQKLLKLESGNEALTDGQTDTQNFKIFGGYNIIPHHTKKGTFTHALQYRGTFNALIHTGHTANFVLTSFNWCRLYNWGD